MIFRKLDFLVYALIVLFFGAFRVSELLGLRDEQGLDSKEVFSRRGQVKNMVEEIKH